MKRKQICALSAISTAVISAFAVSVASAQEVTALEQTEPVKVTASRVEQELMDVNMSVSVITEDQIRHSGARNIGELLKDVPGVRVKNDGSQGMKRISIRGENAFRTLVLIDGQKVSEHKSMSGAPMLIDPAMVERVEVIKGPASVLYGSDAIGGVVNIITKKGGNKHVEGEVSAGLNTSDSGKSASAGIYGGINGWKYRLNAAVEDSDNLDTPKGKMPDTSFTSRSVGSFLSYDLTPDATVGGSLDYYDLEFKSGSYGWNGFLVDVPKWDRTKGALFAEVKNISDVFRRVRSDVFYQKSNKTMLNVIPVGPGLHSNADNTLDQYGFNTQTDWQLGPSHYLIAGYELSYDKLDALSWLSVMGRVGSKNKYEGYQLSNSLFASVESQLPADFTLNYGVRYTWIKNDMDIYDKLANTSENRNGTDSKAVFNAGLLWHSLDNLTLRANFSQGYRSPLLQELYIDSTMGQGFGVTLANPDLKPETSNNFEIGARYESKLLSADLALFYTKAKDYITTVPVAQNIKRYENIQSATTYGAELTLSTRIADTGFEPYSSITLMRRQYDDGFGFKTYNSGTPLLTARYGLRWSGERNGLHLRSDVYAVSQTEQKQKYADSSEDWKLGGYTTLNITTGVSFGPKQQYSLDVGLYNLFNQAYREESSIYEPGRHAALKLNARF